MINNTEKNQAVKGIGKLPQFWVASEVVGESGRDSGCSFLNGALGEA